MTVDFAVSIIIVTHNSQSVLRRCLEAIDCQSYAPSQIIVVDSGSDDTVYLDQLAERVRFTVLKCSNIGFAAANNRGLECIDPGCDYVLFINPDTFLSKSAIEKALEIMEAQQRVAIVTGLLEGYDLSCSDRTGKIDSSGIFRTWYGRWYDRGKGRDIEKELFRPEIVPAVCGALMFCRVSALVDELPELFDPSFFMYKEDIELCVRLSLHGWNVYFFPEIRAFHCRGWNQKRKMIARSARLMSARNEIKLYEKHPSVYIVWAWLKYVLVKLFNV